MNDFKLLTKYYKELESLIQTIRIYNQEVETEFSVEKYAMLKMKSGKREITDLRNMEIIRTFEEKGNFMYFGMLEANIVEKTMKDLPEKSHQRNKHLGNSPCNVF